MKQGTLSWVATVSVTVGSLAFAPPCLAEAKAKTKEANQAHARVVEIDREQTA